MWLYGLTSALLITSNNVNALFSPLNDLNGLVIPLQGNTSLTQSTSNGSKNSDTLKPYAIKSKYDLNIFANNVASNVALKYAEGAQNFMHNTGKSLDFISETEIFKILFNRTGSNPHRRTIDLFDEEQNLQKREQIPVSYQSNILTGYLSFGSTHKDMMINFDTGSSDIWLPGAGPSPNLVYRGDTSTTGKALNREFTITYGDKSSVECEIWVDDVGFGHLIASQQQFGITINKRPLSKIGVAGLAWPSVSKSNSSVIVNTLYNEKQIPKNLFAIDMKNLTLEMGNYHPELVQRMDWVPVTHKAWWVVKDVMINHKSKPKLRDGNWAIDSGTTGIVLPFKDIFYLWSSFPAAIPIYSGGSVFFTFFCNENLGHFSASFGSIQIPFTTKDLTLGQLGDIPNVCVSSIYGTNTPDGLRVIGDTLFKKMYFVFDYETSRVGGGLFV